MALAAINKDRPLPWPILSRSIIVNMQRSRRPLRRFDNGDVSDLDAIRGQVWLWARPDLELNLDPEMPAGLRTRPRDNWAVLVAIADTFGPSRGQAARDAAVAFASTRRAVDLGILLLEDTREIFAALGVDRLLSKELVEHLRDMPDAGWDELPLTPTRLAKMLGAFNNATINLTPRSIWPKERTRRSKSGKGYLREQFESAWAAYCEDEVPPAQKSSKIKHLPSD
jgi:hypothetical protein